MFPITTQQHWLHDSMQIFNKVSRIWINELQNWQPARSGLPDRSIVPLVHSKIYSAAYQVALRLPSHSNGSSQFQHERHFHILTLTISYHLYQIVRVNVIDISNICKRESEFPKINIITEAHLAEFYLFLMVKIIFSKLYFFLIFQFINDGAVWLSNAENQNIEKK